MHDFSGPSSASAQLLPQQFRHKTNNSGTVYTVTAPVKSLDKEGGSATLMVFVTRLSLNCNWRTI